MYVCNYYVCYKFQLTDFSKRMWKEDIKIDFKGTGQRFTLLRTRINDGQL